MARPRPSPGGSGDEADIPPYCQVNRFLISTILKRALKVLTIRHPRCGQGSSKNAVSAKPTHYLTGSPQARA
jgi:hypothetical protein